MWQPASSETYLRSWSLTVDGETRVTASSSLTPVLYEGRPAMLKVPRIEEEAVGGRVLAWWNGRGAAHVWRIDDHAIVLERASDRTLRTLSLGGHDDAATRELCHLAETLHGATAVATPPHGTVPLLEWFGQLHGRAESHPEEHDGLWREASDVASRVLADDSQDVILHGDLHHQNVLDFGADDWRVIDPKGLHGNRIFDYMALLWNPTPDVATACFSRRVDLIAEAAHVPVRTVLEWAFASSALSAAWWSVDGRTAEVEEQLVFARRALARLGDAGAM